MSLLVLNSGSSSVKFSIFAGDRLNMGPPEMEDSLHGAGLDCLETIFARITQVTITAVGYRVVHPGPKLDRHQRITPAVLQDLEDAGGFAPLHDPEAVAIIRRGMDKYPGAAHFACFDTIFHQTMPPEASTCPIPKTYRDAGVRRYGFHGLACESVVQQLGAAGLPRRLIVAHLGSGCSVTAVLDGRSLDTSMGLTPTGGVVMGTRPGDLDPDLVLHMIRQAGGTVQQVENDLNHRSGTAALSGQPNDMKAVRNAALSGDPDALLAIQVFTRSVRKCIGSFCWLMGGVDAIAFSGGIGEHDAATRKEILEGLEQQGITVDSTLNNAEHNGVTHIHSERSSTTILVVSAQENRIIAQHVEQMMAGGDA